MRPGLQYGVSNTTTGFRVTVSGYSHKLLTLLGVVLEKIVGFEVLDDRFEVLDTRCAVLGR
jgi:insulysin